MTDKSQDFWQLTLPWPALLGRAILVLGTVGAVVYATVTFGVAVGVVTAGVLLAFTGRIFLSWL